MHGSLPRQKAFLVQYSSDADSGHTCHCGRIEHVESGRSQRFGSLPELEAFVVRVLSEQNGEAAKRNEPVRLGGTGPPVEPAK